MDKDLDFLFAIQLQNELIDLTNYEENGFIDLTQSSCNVTIDLTKFKSEDNELKRELISSSSQTTKKKRSDVESIVDHSWETIDPNPDVHGLFLAFNRQYFWNTLDSVVVKWSNRMTVCAGLCRYQSGQCSISLSEPLLKLRPRKDLVETLLHEMIHAYLFLTNNREHRDRDGHGPEFCKHMYRINKGAGTNISIYHNFHEEVKLYKQHWWKCNGPCQNRKPFYGYVKRSMNRAPSPIDSWWAQHHATCGGSFIKVKEPEGYGVKKKSTNSKPQIKSANKITNFFKIPSLPTKQIENSSNIQVVEPEQCKGNSSSQDSIQSDDNDTTLCPVCNETVFTSWLNVHLQNCNSLKEMFGGEMEDTCKCVVCNETVERYLMNEHLDNCKGLNNVFDNASNNTKNINYVHCPVCDKLVLEKNINEHLDICTLEEESPIESHSMKQVSCPCCDKKFKNVIELDDHIDRCLLGN
ncbi:DNA-dependent metalloprotease dvc-1 [Adelges cooleyi]|uniref:DNA-dependent metalloprotease dvc-1 n=1 Tax=Adelges cooleyi TaxID=133065 RepID=UPI00217FCF31|nr:DNA-dependent metalloprotease dvc-1 [Adelges cooleyi]